MADVDEEKADACRVNQGEERVVQYLGDKVRDCFDGGLFDKMEIRQVNKDENKNSSK